MCGHDATERASETAAGDFGPCRTGSPLPGHVCHQSPIKPDVAKVICAERKRQDQGGISACSAEMGSIAARPVTCSPEAKALQAENAKLKNGLAEHMLGLAMLKEILGKNF